MNIIRLTTALIILVPIAALYVVSSLLSDLFEVIADLADRAGERFDAFWKGKY